MLKTLKENPILGNLKASKSVEGHVAFSFSLSGSCHTLPFREMHFHDNEIRSLTLQREKTPTPTPITSSKTFGCTNCLLHLQQK